MVDIKKTRSEQQLVSIIDYLTSGNILVLVAFVFNLYIYLFNLAYSKIENLANEKRKLKKILKSWNSSFESKYER